MYLTGQCEISDYLWNMSKNGTCQDDIGIIRLFVDLVTLYVCLCEERLNSDGDIYFSSGDLILVLISTILKIVF